MSGHSHSKKIKHDKNIQDAKKGKIYDKFSKLVMAAAKDGGGDPEKNLKLQEAMDKAKSAGVPKDLLERAIKRGTGDIEGLTFERVTFEGSAPGGITILVDVLTDSRKRAAQEIRNLFERNNGSLGGGTAAWNFETKGIIVIPSEGVDEGNVLDLVAELKSEYEVIDGNFEVICAPEIFQHAKTELAKKFKIESAEVTFIPKSYIKVDDNIAKKTLHLLEALEDHDDVQGVFSNVDFSDSIKEKSSS